MSKDLHYTPAFISKYGYNGYEMAMMTIITAITNLNGIPTVLLFIRNKQPHSIFFSILVVLTSFMYHFCDSIGSDQILLTEGEWHKLDNIAAICSISELLNYFMQNGREIHQWIMWSSFILTMIVQEGYPWDLNYTLGPIILYASMLIIKKLFYKCDKEINRKAFVKGIIFLVVAVICFSKGLDDHKDYLRFWHGMWHVFICIQFFYMFQLYEVKAVEIWEVKKICHQIVQNNKRTHEGY